MPACVYIIVNGILDCMLASLAIYEDNFIASDNQYSTVHHLAINHSFPESPSTLVDTYIYLKTNVCAWIHACLRSCIRECICGCVYVLRLSDYVSAHIYVCVLMCACMYACICVCVVIRKYAIINVIYARMNAFIYRS